MDLQSEILSDALVVKINEPRIDAACAIQFKDLMRELSASGPSRVILDMESVEFVDSSGIGAIVGVMKMVRPQRSLELAALTSAVQKVFNLTRLDSVFVIHDNMANALSQN